MTYASDFGFEFGPITEALATQIQDLVGDKGTVIGTVGIDLALPNPTDAPRTTHQVTTSVYVDSAGHAHIIVIDEVTSAGSVTLEILADVTVN